MSHRVTVSVVIPTLNEEIHIRRCIESVQWADEIFVVDAFSTDSTVEIAETCGAQVFRHKWEGYSEQKNWALEHLPFTNEWVLFLDADEYPTPELVEEIWRKVTEVDNDIAGYYVNRRMIFLGRWLKHCWWYPDRTLRLFKHRLGRFDSRSVHERVVLQGKAGYLKHDLIHENLKSLHEYIDRHNRYSTLEALEMYRIKVQKQRGDFNAAFFGDWGQRRRAIKEKIWYNLPLRPLVRFLWMYFFRLGFLDGREGLIFTLLASIQEFHINAKYYELVLRQGDPYYRNIWLRELEATRSRDAN